jgi:hypothetical protein
MAKIVRYNITREGCARFLLDGANAMLRYTWTQDDTVRRIITNAINTNDAGVVE